jgi:hypothetical protein
MRESIVLEYASLAEKQNRVIESMMDGMNILAYIIIVTYACSPHAPRAEKSKGVTPQGVPTPQPDAGQRDVPGMPKR